MVHNINKMSLEGYPVEGYARILGSEHERLEYIVVFVCLFCYFFMCSPNLGATHTEAILCIVEYFHCSIIQQQKNATVQVIKDTLTAL